LQHAGLHRKVAERAAEKADSFGQNPNEKSRTLESKEGTMRILAEVVLVIIIAGGAVVFYRAIWKMMDKDDAKKSGKKRGME
jgi:hypothetical protein